MAEGLRLLYPPGYDFSSEVRIKDFGFVRALQLDDMVVFARDNFRGYGELSLDKFFSTDPDVIDYRL